MKNSINFKILAQPDDTTCGPTCLQAVYAHYGDSIGIKQVVAEVPTLISGGTLAVHLASHALKRGYEATIYTYNLQVFDPTWFDPSRNIDLGERLNLQMKTKKDAKLMSASKAYIEFLNLGGKVLFKDLSRSLIRSYLKRNIPLITGLSSTYLYRSMREFGPDDEDDDIRGCPSGHFVVICGYNQETHEIDIADPLESNPMSKNQSYSVSIDRLIGAIFLGVLTYDANFLIIEPKRKRKS